ncbi:MAG: NrsF family protein [Bryobacteraceae bacterium]
MTCDQLDDLRNQGSSPGHALPRSAQEHLQSCGRCREFQAFWDAPMPGAEVPAEVQARITQGIVSTLWPVSPLPSDRVLVTTLLLLAVVVVAAGRCWLGEAGWQALAPSQSAVVFSLLAASMLVIAYVTCCQMVPAALQRISPGLAITGVCAAVSGAILLLFPYEKDVHFLARGLSCWALGLICATAAAIVFFGVLRRSASLSPLRLGASTGFLAGLVGLAVLEIYCPYLDRGHIGVWHLGAALTAMLIGIGVAAVGLTVRGRKRVQTF